MAYFGVDIFIFSTLFQTFTWKLTLDIARLGNFTTYGSGHSKKIAK